MHVLRAMGFMYFPHYFTLTLFPAHLISSLFQDKGVPIGTHNTRKQPELCTQALIPASAF